MSAIIPGLIPVQRRLSRLGLYADAADGEWGPNTQAAIHALLDQAEKMAPAPQSASVSAKTRRPLPKLPQQWAWLANVGTLPRHLQAMLSLYGVTETPGAPSNPEILGWARDLGGAVATSYLNDGIPWCGLAIAHAMQLADREIVKDPLWALNWSKWGEDGGQPELGDLLTFQRDGGGHVALYIGEDKAGRFYVLGGNQGDKVSIMPIARTRMKACRQPPYTVKPACVRPYLLSAIGTLSVNER